MSNREWEWNIRVWRGVWIKEQLFLPQQLEKLAGTVMAKRVF